jgi:hypothetical protein
MGRYRTGRGMLPSGVSMLFPLNTKFRITRKINGNEKVKKAAGGFLQNAILS